MKAAINLLGALIGISVMVLVAAVFVHQTNNAQTLPDPIAYCLSTLNECTPDKQKAFEGKVPGDLRAVNGGTQDPVTLVYLLPERDNHTDYQLMVAPYYTNYCLRFDMAAPAVCTERKLTHIHLPADAKIMYSEAVQMPDARVKVPKMIWGTPIALQSQSTSERDTIKQLNGWYAFICFAALFQLMTQRNQSLSLCLALIMVVVIARINTSANNGFSGVEFFNPDLSRIVVYLSIPTLSGLMVHYYAQLVDNHMRRTRWVFYAMCTLVASYILSASQPAEVLLSLQLAQFIVLIALVLVLFCIFNVMPDLDIRQSFTLIFGVSAVVSCTFIDLYFIFQTKPIIDVAGMTPYGLAIETMCQYILIALRNDAAHHEARKLQKKLVATLQNRETELTLKVEERTAELQATNTQLVQAVETAETARAQTSQALSELEVTMQQLKMANDLLQLMAITDGLTKVNNRSFFDKNLQEECRRAQRMKIPLSLIILDIDFFKKINDTYGHPGGDACLRAMASLIQSKITRAGDIVARFGGEEFVILLPDCDVQNAVKFAESLRMQVQQMQVQFEKLTICFTASFGVACGSPGTPFNTELLLSQADAALYQAKRDGRNCVRTLANDLQP